MGGANFDQILDQFVIIESKRCDCNCHELLQLGKEGNHYQGIKKIGTFLKRKIKESENSYFKEKSANYQETGK